MTYEEFLKLEREEGVIYEWINDKLQDFYNLSSNILQMSFPSLRHQTVSANLSNIFNNYLAGKKCRAFTSGFGVFLNSPTAIVSPDLTIVCDPAKISNRGCEGSPDLVVEILSPSTTKKDLTIKYDLYEKNLIKEYWIVYPSDSYITVCVLNEETKKYDEYNYSNSDIIYSTLFPNLPIELEFVFESYTYEEFKKYVNERIWKD